MYVMFLRGWGNLGGGSSGGMEWVKVWTFIFPGSETSGIFLRISASDQVLANAGLSCY